MQHHAYCMCLALCKMQVAVHVRKWVVGLADLVRCCYCYSLAWRTLVCRCAGAGEAVPAADLRNDQVAAEQQSAKIRQQAADLIARIALVMKARCSSSIEC